MTGESPAVLLLTHRGLARGLLEAAAGILGFEPELDQFTNEGLSPEALEARVRDWLDRHPGPAVILTDLGFGSCTQCARRVSRRRPEVGVIAGVNLPVLLAALRSRDLEDLDSLLAHLSRRGREGVEIFRGGTPR